MSHGLAPEQADEQRWEDVQHSDRFAELRRRFRRFAFPVTIIFLIWYGLYVLLSTYAVKLMSTPVIGSINLGLIFGLLQFVSTFVITGLYIRHANRKLDPIAGELRSELEGGQQ